MINEKKVSIIGAGSWGTALAKVLTDNGYNVFLWSKNEKIVNDINNFHTNKSYLPNQVLPTSIQCSTNIEDVLKDTSLILFVIPSHAMREVLSKISTSIPYNVHMVHATKGFEIPTFKRMSQIITEFFPTHNISVLSGPSHAEEVVKGFPTTITLASNSLEDASIVRDYFMTSYFRVYTSTDVCGVELGGSLKNIYAIGAGISDGLGFGDNAKAAILSRGLKEMIILSSELGANRETVYGLSGNGDLIVTGTSKLSRNWKTGYLLGKGFALKEALDEVGMVAEGIKATEAVHFFCQRNKIEMPIVHEIYKIIFEDKSPNEAVMDLMSRDKKNEC